MASYMPLTIILVCFMVAAAMLSTVPAAQALGVVPIFVNVKGRVHCPVHVASGTAAPPFPNATVKLTCQGTIVETAVTNSTGNFPMNNITATQPLLSNLLSDNCMVALAACNNSSTPSQFSGISGFFMSMLNGVSVGRFLPGITTGSMTVNMEASNFSVI